MKNQALKILTAITAGVMFAVFSMSCCLAPLLFILFGISAASLSFLDFLAPYRIVFSVIAVASLFYGYWKLYISKKPFCSSRFINEKTLKILFWILTGISLLALFYPFVEQIIFIGDEE